MRPPRSLLVVLALALAAVTLPTAAVAGTATTEPSSTTSTPPPAPTPADETPEGEAAEGDCELRSKRAREAARPQDLAERYGYASLHRDGHDGRGLIAAQLQFGQSVSVPRLRQFETCLKLGAVPVTQVRVRNDADPVAVEPEATDGLPAPGREAQSDAEMIVSSAPGLDHLYVLVADSETNFYETLTTMLRTLASGEATGGRVPDLLSVSYGQCEADLTREMVASTETALEALARAGTWFFKGAGDSGSTDCTDKAVCATGPQSASVHYPASSPWVTAVGGVEVTGPQPEGRRASGPATVWNSRVTNPDVCSGGGGGTSSFYPTPGYQRTVPGGAVPTMRGVPDITALASTPGLLTLLPNLPPAPPADTPAGGPTGGSDGTGAGPSAEQTWSWVPNGGDSLSGPLMAGAFASLRSALIARGVEVPVLLNPVLYRIANDPSLAAQVFRDVTAGNNDLYGVGCCSATVGYDLASGLGEIDIAGLLAVLAPEAPVPPAFTG